MTPVRERSRVARALGHALEHGARADSEENSQQDRGGDRDERGAFPPESVNGRVEATLVTFAERRRAFMSAPR